MYQTNFWRELAENWNISTWVKVEELCSGGKKLEKALTINQCNQCVRVRVISKSKSNQCVSKIIVHAVTLLECSAMWVVTAIDSLSPTPSVVWGESGLVIMYRAPINVLLLTLHLNITYTMPMLYCLRRGFNTAKFWIPIWGKPIMSNPPPLLSPSYNTSV